MSDAPPPPEEPAAPQTAPTPRDPRPGGSIWGGVGIGCGAYVLFGALMLPLIGAGLFAGFGGLILYFLVPAIVGVFVALSERARRIGLGMLIAAAASWLVVIGPCMGLLSGL
ncbi:MAG: hypothetical protein D3X82_10015 [Candidatus Leucobacter sulfamidivorax]|nr:hypothetical protein [Candidatus Leucobacter sulfamidivorax]